MIHIRKGRTGQYRVVYTGNNGEILSTSETLKSKQSAWKNIRANWKHNHSPGDLGIYVQDNTGNQPTVYLVDKVTKYKYPCGFEPTNLVL